MNLHPILQQVKNLTPSHDIALWELSVPVDSSFIKEQIAVNYTNYMNTVMGLQVHPQIASVLTFLVGRTIDIVQGNRGVNRPRMHAYNVMKYNSWNNNTFYNLITKISLCVLNYNAQFNTTESIDVSINRYIDDLVSAYIGYVWKCSAINRLVKIPYEEIAAVEMAFAEHHRNYEAYVKPYLGRDWTVENPVLYYCYNVGPLGYNDPNPHESVPLDSNSVRNIMQQNFYASQVPSPNTQYRMETTRGADGALYARFVDAYGNEAPPEVQQRLHADYQQRKQFEERQAKLQAAQVTQSDTSLNIMSAMQDMKANQRKLQEEANLKRVFGDDYDDPNNPNPYPGVKPRPAIGEMFYGLTIGEYDPEGIPVFEATIKLGKHDDAPIIRGRFPEVMENFFQNGTYHYDKENYQLYLRDHTDHAHIEGIAWMNHFLFWYTDYETVYKNFARHFVKDKWVMEQPTTNMLAYPIRQWIDPVQAQLTRDPDTLLRWKHLTKRLDEIRDVMLSKGWISVNNNIYTMHKPIQYISEQLGMYGVDKDEFMIIYKNWIPTFFKEIPSDKSVPCIHLRGFTEQQITPDILERARNQAEQPKPFTRDLQEQAIKANEAIQTGIVPQVTYDAENNRCIVMSQNEAEEKRLQENALAAKQAVDYTSGPDDEDDSDIEVFDAIVSDNGFSFVYDENDHITSVATYDAKQGKTIFHRDPQVIQHYANLHNQALEKVNQDKDEAAKFAEEMFEDAGEELTLGSLADDNVTLGSLANIREKHLNGTPEGFAEDMFSNDKYVQELSNDVKNKLKDTEVSEDFKIINFTFMKQKGIKPWEDITDKQFTERELIMQKVSKGLNAFMKEKRYSLAVTIPDEWDDGFAFEYTDQSQLLEDLYSKKIYPGAFNANVFRFAAEHTTYIGTDERTIEHRHEYREDLDPNWVGHKWKPNDNQSEWIDYDGETIMCEIVRYPNGNPIQVFHKREALMNVKDHIIQGITHEDEKPKEDNTVHTEKIHRPVVKDFTHFKSGTRVVHSQATSNLKTDVLSTHLHLSEQQQVEQSDATTYQIADYEVVACPVDDETETYKAVIKIMDDLTQSESLHEVVHHMTSLKKVHPYLFNNVNDELTSMTNRYLKHEAEQSFASIDDFHADVPDMVDYYRNSVNRKEFDEQSSRKLINVLLERVKKRFANSGEELFSIALVEAYDLDEAPIKEDFETLFNSEEIPTVAIVKDIEASFIDEDVFFKPHQPDEFVVSYAKHPELQDLLIKLFDKQDFKERYLVTSKGDVYYALQHIFNPQRFSIVKRQ